LPAVTSGQVGCAPADITITDEADDLGTRTWTAECQGKTYYCSMHGGGRAGTSQVSCKENTSDSASAAQGAPSASQADAPKTEPPETAPAGAGGFAFGATEEEAKRICEAAGHRYTSMSPGRGACDGVAADVGLPAKAQFEYCREKACGVALVLPLRDGESLAQAVIHWKSKLSEKYGTPTSATGSIPSDCQDDLSSCLADGRATVDIVWKWPSGQLIVLDVTKGGNPAMLRISYRAPGRDVAAPGL
jgi:hypothetical protein